MPATNRNSGVNFRRLNAAFFARHDVRPVGQLGDTLLVAMPRPADGSVIAALRFATGLPVKAVEFEPESSQNNPSLADRIAARWSAAGRDDPAMIPDLHMRIAEDEAWLVTPGSPEVAIGYADRDGWRSLESRIGPIGDVRASVCDDALLTLELPEAPRDEAELRVMIARYAPLRLRDLAWTEVFGCDGSGARVALVRRKWLDDRIATVEARLRPQRIEVRDAAGHRFAFRTRAARRRAKRFGLILAFVALAVLAAAAVFGPARDRGAAEPAGPKRPASVVRPQATAQPAAVAPAQPPPPVASFPAGIDSDKLTLVGIAGRLPNDARVLVRTPWGRTETLQLGDSLLGWRIVAVTATGVTLDRAGERRQLVIEPENSNTNRLLP